MKKILCVVLALAMVLSLCACGGKSETGKLVVGFDAEFPPFGFLAEDGSYDGFDLALAKEVCNRLGWEFEAVAIDWNSKDTELSSGNINCIWNGFTYTGREDEYTWSDPYVDNSIVLEVVKDEGQLKLGDTLDIPVPDVKGKSYEEAERILKAAGLTVTMEIVSSDTVPKDEVMAQDPEPGTMAAENQPVALQVSGGKEQRQVPQIMYMTREKAEEAEKAEKELNKIQQNYFANVAHEFRTPLTMIAGPAQQLSQAEDIQG